VDGTQIFEILSVQRKSRYDSESETGTHPYVRLYLASTNYRKSMRDTRKRGLEARTGTRTRGKGSFSRLRLKLGLSYDSERLELEVRDKVEQLLPFGDLLPFLS